MQLLMFLTIVPPLFRQETPLFLPIPNNLNSKNLNMIKKTLIVMAILTCALIASSFAATIPAGTTLIVRTLNSIHSTDRVGRTFNAQLDQDVAVNGRAVLRAGTKVSGRIEASQANPRNSQPLTLNLTGISVNGRTIPIKTVSGFELQHIPRGRAATRGISVGPFVAPHGTKMEFRLAQPINL
jgi:hypothetical protein